jgi:hypothetical protein
MQRHSAFKLKARVDGLLRTNNPESFETSPVEMLSLGFDGIEGDRHGGPTRRSGGREPWYPRGTEMRNEWQLSILAPDELAAIAKDMGIAELRPEWIGGNLLISGIDALTSLPPRSLLMFDGGVTIRIDGYNVPCRFSGRSVARHFADRENLDLAFVNHARYRRGLVGWVEKPGTIRLGEKLEVRVPEQWIYTA